MIVAIVTFQLPKATTAEEMAASFEAAVPMFQSGAGNSPVMVDHRDRKSVPLGT